eukprot:360753-Chlamydomonas_euryale.AAC.7
MAMLLVGCGGDCDDGGCGGGDVVVTVRVESEKVEVVLGPSSLCRDWVRAILQNILQNMIGTSNRRSQESKQPIRFAQFLVRLSNMDMDGGSDGQARGHLC